MPSHSPFHILPLVSDTKYLSCSQLSAKLWAGLGRGTTAPYNREPLETEACQVLVHWSLLFCCSSELFEITGAEAWARALKDASYVEKR